MIRLELGRGPFLLPVVARAVRAAGAQAHLDVTRLALAAAAAEAVAGAWAAATSDDLLRVAEEAAERIERFAAYLRDSDTDTILADARDLGRRRPAAVVAGAAVLGIVAGRLVRASGPSGSREVSR
jgi:hypothetical protein